MISSSDVWLTVFASVSVSFATLVGRGIGWSCAVQCCVIKNAALQSVPVWRRGELVLLI